MNTTATKEERIMVLVTREQIEFIRNAAKRRQMLMSQVLLTDSERHYTTERMLSDLLVMLSRAEGKVT